MRWPKSHFVFFLILGVFLHLGLGHLSIPQIVIVRNSNNNEPIEVTKWVEEKKQVVRTERSSKALNELRKARFGAEFKNRVKEEMKARLTGRYKNREAEAGLLTEPGNGIATRRSNRLGLSTNPYKLPDDIAEGNQTLLNTDPVLYASFSNRISDEIYGPWVTNVRRALEGIRATGDKLESNLYVTRLKVRFDEAGQVLSITILDSSGYASIDEAAKKAFWEREPFPNPPVQYSKNGILDFSYEFHLDIQDSFFDVRPWGV